MSQMSLFADDSQVVIIPGDLVSPLESKSGLKSKKFRKEQKRWAEFVRAIQGYHKCSWFEARELLIKHRDEQTPIKIKNGGMKND